MTLALALIAALFYVMAVYERRAHRQTRRDAARAVRTLATAGALLDRAQAFIDLLVSESFGGESVNREARSLETQALADAATRPPTSPPNDTDDEPTDDQIYNGFGREGGVSYMAESSDF